MMKNTELFIVVSCIIGLFCSIQASQDRTFRIKNVTEYRAKIYFTCPNDSNIRSAIIDSPDPNDEKNILTFPFKGGMRMMRKGGPHTSGGFVCQTIDNIIKITLSSYKNKERERGNPVLGVEPEKIILISNTDQVIENPSNAKVHKVIPSELNLNGTYLIQKKEDGSFVLEIEQEINKMEK